MEQVSSNVVVLRYPDPMIEDAGAIKILLTGSSSIYGDPNYDWQNKFIEGLVKLVDPTPDTKTGIMMYSKFNYIVVDPRSNAQNQEMVLDNPDFVNGFSYYLDMAEKADAIILNFLQKSTAPKPLFDLGYLIRSGKTVVRCSPGYMQAGLVNVVCQRFNVPLLPGKQGHVLSVLQAMFAFCNVVRDKQQYQLPE